MLVSILGDLGPALATGWGQEETAQTLFFSQVSSLNVVPRAFVPD